MKRRTPDLREWWGRCHWQENSEAKTVSPCHRRTWKNIFSFWIFMNIFSSMQTQNGFLWTFLALWKHNIKRIWRLWWLWPKNHFAKWKERNASMTQMYMIWNIFNLRKCLRRKGKVIAAYQELAVWCKIGGGGERIGGGRHGKGGGEDRIGGGGGRWPPKLMNCTA